MAIDSTAFLVRFPEFAESDTDLIDAKLAEALGALSSTILGDRFDEAQGYLTAHLLALSPYGMQARLQAAVPTGETTYWQRYAQIAMEAGAGPFVP